MDLVREDYIVPICRANDDTRRIQEYFGTAFFISSEGVFLSAGHCIPQDTWMSLNLGLITKGKNKESLFSKITKVDHAPNNLDVVVGKIDFTAHSKFKLLGTNIYMGQDVISLGYPEDAIERDEGFWLNVRLHKGYVQRIIAPGKLPHTRNGGRLLELNFGVTAGLSGAPLYIPILGSPYDALVGICIGNHQSERLLDSITEIEEDGKVYKESSKKYEYAGLAQDITEILDWKPNFLDKTIREIMEYKA